jgi:uncharacterized protein YbcC (UPF0753/DUF2309 family)
MSDTTSSFSEQEALHLLKHYLPAQAPLKDFIHHNSLHAFQHLNFHEALRNASGIFGYNTSLSIHEFRELYHRGRIRPDILDRVILEQGGRSSAEQTKKELLSKTYPLSFSARTGQLRSLWESMYRTDLDLLTHPVLFRTLCSYLDQGISVWNFPVLDKGFLCSLRELEKYTYTSLFRNKRARDLLFRAEHLSELLQIVVGREDLYLPYLCDQQFAHPGWSGIVSVVEDLPGTLMDEKKISLRELIFFELLLEIDALDSKFGENWAPLGNRYQGPTPALFADVPETDYHRAIRLWQEAYEWTYYDEVLAGLSQKAIPPEDVPGKSFQAVFCIDDREISLRDHLERSDTQCETFATPGFFGVEFYFQPRNGKSYIQQCPASLKPGFLIKEQGGGEPLKKEPHFSKQTHGLLKGGLLAPTLGFWSAGRLLLNIFRPSLSPATSLSFSHMHKDAELTILHQPGSLPENGLQIGFTFEQMADRVEVLLKSMGMTRDFAPLVYMVGHGASSTNNPHYNAYNCGACCGRPGSVNARVIAFMANQAEVRKLLQERGLNIPRKTQFIGGLHDTTRDEIVFYDEQQLSSSNTRHHLEYISCFRQALDLNARERSRRFAHIRTAARVREVHRQVLTRSVSLFEPRPELNHATNALCIIGRRALSKHVFLDRRAFCSSYDYRTDPEGRLLAEILKPIGPVCGGINLEYYFSRTDHQRLGAGTKLPHNVMGLFGVANGADGDLRSGLPSQMTEVHDPIRLMVIVEHEPAVVLRAIQAQESVYEWYRNEWMRLSVIHPLTGEIFVFRQNAFHSYTPLHGPVPVLSDIMPVIAQHSDNLPVYIIR